MIVTRKIIEIDDERCDGCGNCVPSCAEGAIVIVDGKAKVVADKYCDGLGACMGECPQGALKIVEREADEFDEEAVEELLKSQEAKKKTAPAIGGCPSAALKIFPAASESQACNCANEAKAQASGGPSALGHWPVQIHLIPPGAPFLKGADLLIAADCVPVAYPTFHADFLKGKAVMLGCPKFDDVQSYIDKFTQIFSGAGIKSITAVVMEVPCCSGMAGIIKKALENAGVDIPFKEVVISSQGKYPLMKWSLEAEAAIKKVPFFVRKKVRKKVEAHAQGKGKKNVDLDDVTSLKKQFLSKGGMEKDLQGYDISTCFGGEGCPNSANSCASLSKDIQALMEAADILSFLKSSVQGDLKFHHEFRVSMSDCPNACSRPQIVDIGIIGASIPSVGGEDCTLCNSCVEACPDNAVCLDQKNQIPVIDNDLCLSCGKCIKACPTGTIEEKEKGFQVLLGGRLGRHPRLAMEVPGIQTHDQVLTIVENSLIFYKNNSKNGQRFSKILNSTDQVVP